MWPQWEWEGGFQSTAAGTVTLPAIEDSERHIFINASESISNLPDEKIWSHYSNTCSMPSQLTQLTPWNASAFHHPCFKGYCNICLTHLITSGLPHPFILLHRSQMFLNRNDDCYPPAQNYSVPFTLRIKFKVPNTTYSPNYLVLVIYRSSFISWHSHYFFNKNIHFFICHSSIRWAFVGHLPHVTILF